VGLKLMCITAHPDDECYAFGGALALAADRGVETYVVCLTDGQAATNRGDAADGEALGSIRGEEFRASCEVLGVTHYELMNYQDAQLVMRMRRFRPDIVITFGGDGGQNTHPDHMIASMLTTAAFHWSGQPKRYPGAGDPHKAHRLYYVTANFLMPDRQPALTMPWSVALDIRAARERKNEASRRHVSQAPLMEKTQEIFARYGAEEFYALAATTEPEVCRLRTDLFEGLT
jgi:LmbE family N-acetylglucosaminyl deacetylase